MPTVPPPHPTMPLQFERVEPTEVSSPVPTCSDCKQPIHNLYYEVDGRVLDARCKEACHTTLSQRPGVAGFLRALALGGAAALLGAGLWYGIRLLTGYEFGLVALVIGLLVGGAVRYGSYQRGGWLYQTLAIALTYAAIVSTYIPDIVQVMIEDWRFQEAALSQPSSATGALPGEAEPPALPPGRSLPDDPTATRAAMEAGAPSLVSALLAILFVFGLACLAPFLAGLANIMGLIIIGIALYEAWKMNRRLVVSITGPHQLGVTPATQGVLTTRA